MAAVGREELYYPAECQYTVNDLQLSPYQLPLLISVSMVAGPSSIMGGTVSPLNIVSGVLSSQSSFLAVAWALEVSAASVEANVASDRREYNMERIAAMAEGRAARVRQRSAREGTRKLLRIGGAIGRGCRNYSEPVYHAGVAEGTSRVNEGNRVSRAHCP